MTRYLDRGPQVGDTIEVNYVTVVRALDESKEGGCVYRVPGYRLTSECVGCEATATVRVIAPEPRVGDVVTSDMDLPEGTIIEQQGDSYSTVRRTKAPNGTAWRGDGKWFTDLTFLLHLYDAYSWRIVRIGGGQ